MLDCPACSSSNVKERTFYHNKKSRLLSQCNHCGHAFDINHLDSNEGYAHGDYGLVDGKIPNYDRDLKLARTLITSFLIKPHDKILDFGAGWGGLALRIAQISEEHSLGIQVSCYEPVQRLGNSIREKNPSIVVHSNIADIKNSGGNDFVILKEVIEHSNSPKDLLETLSGTMNIGATLLVTCPGHANALEQKLGNPTDYQAHGHLHFFTNTSLTALAKRTKLFDIRTTALLDQYLNQFIQDYTDQEKSTQILQMLSNRANKEVNHIQALLRFTGKG